MGLRSELHLQSPPSRPSPATCAYKSFLYLSLSFPSLLFFLFYFFIFWLLSLKASCVEWNMGLHTEFDPIFSTQSPLTSSDDTTTTMKSKKAKSAEEKAAAKAKKAQNDDLDSLQITFYEIESWIEKTTPVLARMTNELDKVSHRFEKQRPQTYHLPQQQNQQQPHIQRSLQQPQGQPSFQQSQQPPQPPQPPQPQQQHAQSPTEEDDSMQWVLSFQPGNNLRLETNITSVEQLVDAVQKMRLLAGPTSDNEQWPSQHHHYDSPDVSFASSYSSASSSTSSGESSSSSLSIPWTGSDQIRLGPSTEYWCTALQRRPRSCLEDYKDCDEMNLGKLTENVSPHVLNYACQMYWDCLHPKFSADWSTFWDRSGDPKRNQVCIDSGLAMIFLHLIRHHKNSCPNANEIGYYYYERSREALMDYFDSPDCATLETLMNLAMFCILCKRHSQARIYIGLAYRMILDMGIHQQSSWPKDDLDLRRKYLKLFMVLYYNDISVSMYSGEPTQLNDLDIDVDFYDLITVNRAMQAPPDDKTMVKETFFAHLLSLAKIGKRTLLLMEEYQRQHKGKQHVGELPLSWANQVQSLEVALATWFDRLPEEYRVDPQPTTIPASSSPSPSSPSSSATATTMASSTASHSIPPPLEHSHVAMNAASLQKQSSLLLMLQYQTQWILLHKPFANIDPSPLATTLAAAAAGSSATSIPPQGADRSREICTDAADRIVVMGELITENYGWCVCQQFMSCIYQASTIYCRNALCMDEDTRQHAKTMIMRVIRILGSSRVNYSGLPDDLTCCLSEFLTKNGMQPPEQDSGPGTPSTATTTDGTDSGNGDNSIKKEDPDNANGPTTVPDGCQLLDHWVSFHKDRHTPDTSTLSFTSSASTPIASSLERFNDDLYNSPHRHLDCLHQQSLYRSPLTASYHQTDAMLSIKIQEPVVDNSMTMDFQLEQRKNWR